MTTPPDPISPRDDDATEEDEPIAPLPLWKRLLRAIIALALLGGLLYTSGIYQYFFLHRTPTNVEQPVLASKLAATHQTVPVTAHILSGSSGSERTEDDVYRLITNANNIWAQADIAFHIQEIRHLTVTTKDLQQFADQPHQFIQQSGSHNSTTANIYLSRTLQGVNGLAYGGTSAVSVADYTSTLDFRTLAHEFGHLLGLEHVPNPRRLMATGARGVELSEEEILTARNQAEHFPRAE